MAELHAFPTPARSHFSPAEECADLPAIDWLSGQARVVACLRDRLLEANAEPRLVAVLDQHASFLAEALDALR